MTVAGLGATWRAFHNYLTRDLRHRHNEVLTGGTYFCKIGRSVDQATIWGDFYYLEALLRWPGRTAIES